MKKIFVLIITACFCFNIDASEPTPKKVLLLGNSLTSYKKNKLPEILKEFIEFSDHEIEVDVFAKNGSSLYGHYFTEWLTERKGIADGDPFRSTAMNLIKEKKYDIVVVQERGNSILNSYFKKRKFLPILDSMKRVVESYGGQIYLYENDSFLIGDSMKVCYKSYSDFISNEYEETKNICSSVYYSSKQIHDTLEVTYQKIKKDYPTIQNIPFNAASLRLSKDYEPKILTDKFGHPKPLVQYFLAAMFYSAITKQSPEKIKFDYKLKTEEAAKMKKLAWEIWSSSN